jgi:hypothetical protein
MAAGGSVIQSVVSGIALIGFYGLVLWRIVKRNAGNRVIESGVLALAVAFVMVAAMKIPNLPDWVGPSLGILFLLLGFLMIFFLIQQGYNAIRRRKRNS